MNYHIALAIYICLWFFCAVLLRETSSQSNPLKPTAHTICILMGFFWWIVLPLGIAMSFYYMSKGRGDDADQM